MRKFRGCRFELQRGGGKHDSLSRTDPKYHINYSVIFIQKLQILMEANNYPFDREFTPKRELCDYQFYLLFAVINIKLYKLYKCDGMPICLTVGHIQIPSNLMNPDL